MALFSAVPANTAAAANAAGAAADPDCSAASAFDDATLAALMSWAAWSLANADAASADPNAAVLASIASFLSLDSAAAAAAGEGFGAPAAGSGLGAIPKDGCPAPLVVGAAAAAAAAAPPPAAPPAAKAAAMLAGTAPGLKLAKSPCGASPAEGFEGTVPGGTAWASMLPMLGTPSINANCNMGLIFFREYNANFFTNVLMDVPMHISTTDIIMLPPASDKSGPNGVGL